MRIKNKMGISQTFSDPQIRVRIGMTWEMMIMDGDDI